MATPAAPNRKRLYQVWKGSNVRNLSLILCILLLNLDVVVDLYDRAWNVWNKFDFSFSFWVFIRKLYWV